VRERTAFFNSYERGGQDDDQPRNLPGLDLSDVTRSCTYNGGMTVVTIAVAGRDRAGPEGPPGSVNDADPRQRCSATTEVGFV
jgi:hypothetical protein